MRIVFAGTPDFAAKHLKVLLDHTGNLEYEVVAVYTQPDRASGRGQKLNFSPVKQVAIDAKIPVFQPKTLKTLDAQSELKALKPDLMIVVAYGLLLPQTVLDIPSNGCINVHGSILPRWRGAAPIQRAIEEGDKETGITIMQMDAGLDTGDMLHKVTCQILSSDTSSTLHDRLVALGPEALLATIEKIKDKCLQPECQQHDLATYAHKLNKEECCINWAHPAEKIALKIQALNPWPVAWSNIEDKRVRILLAQSVNGFTQDNNVGLEPGTIICHEHQGEKALYVQCKPGVIRLELLQLSGKNPTKAHDLLNSRREMFKQGLRFN